LICTWHAINFTISGIIEWKFINPEPYVLWNTFFLFEALCILILMIFVWTHWLSRFKGWFQISGHVAGIVLFYFIMGTLSYYFNDYMEGFVFFEH
jgi:two-component system LytT family sensor kinase